ncbi:SpoIIE family protein phosphatase [Streptomyces sp. NPDC008313]|uniref:SpoIIE family protein phosphatase n=1 Tax=Streptomyces sp. NPDC008313 TaxID=3364826 RepID=UPI0036ED6B0B
MDRMPFEEVTSAARDAGGWLGDLRVAVVATSADGRIVRWDHTAQDLLGYTSREVVGRHIAELLHPGADRGLGRSLWESAARGCGVTGTVTAWHRDGHPMELEIWAAPVPARRHGGTTVLVFAADAYAARHIRGSSAVWDGLFARSPVGIAVFDEQLRFLRVNPALEAMNGMPQAAHVGRRLVQLLPGVNAAAMEALMREVLATGVPHLDFRRTGRTPADPDHDRVWSCSWVRIEDPDGRPIGLTATFIDITAQQQAQMEAEVGRRRLALINEASLKIGTTLDLERTAQELADVAVPDLADCVTVDVLDTLTTGDPIGSGLVGGAGLRRLGKSPLTGSPVSDVLAPLGRTMTFPAGAPYTRALTDRTPYVLARFDAESVASAVRHSAAPAKLLETGVHSFMMVPLLARGVVLGLATFYRHGTPGPFTDGDVNLAGELAARAAVCVDNARLYHREHDTALILQRSMLPQHVTPPPGIEVAHRYLPAGDVNEVGGDWYDVIRLEDGRAALAIGDVMGHGTQAAAVMGRLSASVRALARLSLSPEDLLHQLDAALDDLAEPTLATFLYIVVDCRTGECRMTRAGHPPPALVLPDGTVRLLHASPGAPLGVGGTRFVTTGFTLPRGGLLVLYTDGLVEARGSDIDDRLAELTHLLARPAPSLDALCDSLLSHLVPASADDDIALLAARLTDGTSTPPDQVTPQDRGVA